MAWFSVAVSLFCLAALSSAELCTRDGSYRRDYPGQCSKYVECVHGRSTVESCGWFHRFDEATNQCQFHFFGSAFCSESYPTEKPTIAPTKASVIAMSLADDQICTRDGTYKTFYPGNCEMYYNCNHGKPSPGSCGWFHRFDEKSADCKFHWLFFGSADCSKALSPAKKQATPTTTNLESVLAMSLADDQICRQSGTYKTFFPGDCDKYYNCNHGQATVESCGWFHRFDEKSADCKFHWLFIGSVDCSKALSPTKKPTTPTTTTTSGSTTTKDPKVTTTTKASSVTPSTASTSTTVSPNSVTTKHNGAGSVQISMILATICTFATIFRHLQ